MLSRHYLTVTSGFGLRSLALSALVVVLARAFGPSEFGGYAVALSLASFAATFNGLGAGPLHVRDVAQARRTYAENLDLVMHRVLAWLLPLALVALAGGWLLVPHNVDVTAVAMVVMGELLYYAGAEAAMRVMQAREQYTGMTITLAALPVLRVVIAVLLLLEHVLDLALWAWVSLGTGLGFFGIVFGTWLWRSRCRTRTHVPLFAESMSGLGFAVANASARIHGDADKVILARVDSTVMAGVYTPAYRLVEVFLLPISAGVEWLLPALFRQGQAGFGGSLRASRGKIILTLLYTLALCVGVYLAAFALPLILGRAYAGAVPMAQALALMPLTMTGWIIVRTLAATSGYERSAGVAELAGAVFNVIVTIALVAAWSWRGAVAATYLTQIAMALGFVLFMGLRAHHRAARQPRA